MKIIAETAFNHNGDIEYLLELVKVAADTGADYVTVQIMDTKSFCVSNYGRYQIYLDTEISQSDWTRLFDFCGSQNINLLPCVLEEASFDLCYNSGFRLFKIHATDINNKPFLESIAKTDSRIILETQCATNFDIRFALSILKDKVECIIHGFSDYPTQLEDLNLNALNHIASEFALPIGFADHTLDVIEIPLMCLAKGCEYFEKHITLDRSNKNFDWQVSLEPASFTEMVDKIKHYQKSLGIGIKHPTQKELSYRTVLYKKQLLNSNEMKRCDFGLDYIGSKFDKFRKEDTGVAVIARLKSKRLKEKVLKPFHDNLLIVDLCNRVQSSGFPLYLATSALEEDKKLIEACRLEGIQTFTGHPISVIDRMLWLAFQCQWGGIFRVTGDNPYTDPELMKQMYDLFINKDLDYVRVNGIPFGVSAELFSTSYLFNLYLNMDNPMNSEYLSWYVLNDENAKVGSLVPSRAIEDLKFVNLSVDYVEDLERCLIISKSLSSIKFTDIKFDDILKNVNCKDLMDKNRLIKLPDGQQLFLNEYLSLMESKSSVKRNIV